MDFTTALSYPYKSLAKVFTIVLVMTIGVAVFLGMILNSFDWMGYLTYFVQVANYGVSYEFTPAFEPNIPILFVGGLGLVITLIIQGFWISGYSIRTIRAAIDGIDQLPAVQFGSDLGKGFYLFIASILYALLFIPFFAIVAILMAMTAGPTGEGGLAVVIFCGAFIVAIPLFVLMGWAYYVGMARCAVDDNNQVLFQIWTNMRIARANVRASFSLTGYQILLALMYGFISNMLSNVLDTVFTSMGFEFNSTLFMLAFLLPFMLTVALNIVQQFSNMHLVAQYAQRIGIVDSYDDKDKNKNM